MDTDYACLRPWAEVPGLRPPAVRHSPRMHRTANESAPLLPTRTAPQPHRPHSCTTPRALSDAVFGIALSPDMERARVSGGVPRRALRNLRWGNAWMAAPPGHPFFGWLLSQLAPNARHANVMRAAGSRFLTTALEQWIHAHGGSAAAAAVTIHPWGTLYNTKAIAGAPPHPCGNGSALELERCAPAALQRVARHHLLDGNLDRGRLGGQSSPPLIEIY